MVIIIIIIIIIFIHTRSTQILVTTVYTSLENTNVCQIDPQESNYKNRNIIIFLYYFLIAEWLLCYVHLIFKTRLICKDRHTPVRSGRYPQV